MKKLICVLTALMLLLSMVFYINASAASAAATLTGPAALRAGDKITLTFNLNGKGIYGASGTLSYDSSQLTLSGTSQKIASPWAVEFNGNNFVAYDNNLSSPINSNKSLFSVTFTVKSNISTGANVKVSYTNLKASDGSADINIGTVSYTKSVSAPLSTNNKLKTLNVSNARISPAFTADKTSYTASVPFSVSKLNITATAEDSKARVSVKSPNLTPGGTTKATVTVTAENGSKKTYTISVKRESDPNYVASSNNKLSAITVDGYKLSPIFNTDVKNYIVWLPYETESIKVSGTVADKKASVEVAGGQNLAAGQDNTVKVICTAENGDKNEYIIIAKRAAGHDGAVDNKPQEPLLDVQTSTDTTVKNNGIEFWWLIIVGCAAFLIGGGLGFLIKSLTTKKS